MQNHRNGNGTLPRFRRRPVRQRLVDFLHIREDYECAHFGALGFSTKFIQHRTGLSSGRITYRLRKAKLSRMAFRNGESVYADLVLRNMRAVTAEKLIEHLYTVTPPRIGENAGLKRVA